MLKNHVHFVKKSISMKYKEPYAAVLLEFLVLF